MLDFETTVKTRQSIRKFLPTPMTETEIKQILADAQNAPSACNTQTFLLSLTARGLGGIPQLAIAMFAKDVREELGIPDNYTLLHAISFGHPDWDAMQNKHHLGRVPVEESATLHW